MMRTSAYRLTQGVYYLSLGSWFGALVMLVVAATATFATLETYQPTLIAGPAADAALETDASRLLAGAVVGEALRGLTVIQVVCGLAAMLCIGLQTTVFRGRLTHAGRSRANGLRSLLVVGAFVVLLANIFWISPGVWQEREIMYHPDTPPAERQQAQASFQWYHQLSERTTGGAALMIAAAVLISPFAFRVTPAQAVTDRPLTEPAGPGPAAADERASAYE